MAGSVWVGRGEERRAREESERGEEASAEEGKEEEEEDEAEEGTTISGEEFFLALVKKYLVILIL